MGRKPKPDALSDSARQARYRANLRLQVSKNRALAERLTRIANAVRECPSVSLDVLLPDSTGDEFADATALLSAIEVAISERGIDLEGLAEAPSACET